MSDKKLSLRLTCVFLMIGLVIIFTFSSQNVDAISVTYNYNNGTTAGWNGNVWLEKFTGLPVGSAINKLGLNVTATGSTATNFTNNFNAGTIQGYGSGTSTEAWVEAYSGLTPNQKLTDFYLSITSLGTPSDYTNNHPTTNLFDWDGGIWTEPFGTGTTIIPEGTISSVSVKVNSLGGTGQQINNHNAAGNGAGFGPANIWAESFSNIGQADTVTSVIIQTGTGSGNVRVKVYADDSGSGCGSINCPSTLLGESNSVAISTSGLHTISLISPAVIPSSENIWAAFETDSGTLQFTFDTTSGAYNVGHTYGSGPSPFGTATHANTATPYLGINTDSVTAHIRVKLYADDSGSGCGSINCPSTLLGESSSITVSSTGIQTYTISPSVTLPSTGHIWAAFETDSRSLSLVDDNTQGAWNSGTGHVYGSGPSPFGSASNNNLPTPWMQIHEDTITPEQVRAKIYQDDSASTCGGIHCPSTLLGESNTFTLTNTGIKKFNLISPVIIPASGDIWMGFETNSRAVGLLGTAGTGIFHSPFHTFGTGPNPFGTATGGNAVDAWMQVSVNSATTNIRAKIYKDDGASTCGGNCPSTLLGESSSTPIYSTGVQNATLTGTVPASGNIWAGFEVNSSSLALKYNTTASGIVVNLAHVFGIGPSPSGSVTNKTTANWLQITYSNANTVQFRPTLHDNATQLTSATIKVTNGSGTFSQLANNTGWVKFSGMSGLQNFTVFDDKNFESLKLINYNIQSNIAKNLATYDYPINCIGFYTGYQSDFIIRINDTDGTYITNISKPDCTSRTDMIFNMTFSGLGKSGNSFATSMLTSIGNLAYQANAKQFTVNSNNVTTIFTGNTNLISNSFTVGSGLTNHTLNFDITLGAVQSVLPNPSGSGGLPNPSTNVTCTDPLGCAGNQCQYGINPDGSCFDPSCPSGENCNHLECPANSILYNNECIVTQPQICPDGSQPVNGICGTGNPTCPANTTLINGSCIEVKPQLCPNGSQPVNGQCKIGNPEDCPVDTTLVNGQCVVITNPITNTCPLGTNADGSCITSPTQDQCTANPIICLLGGGGGGGKITVGGITYTPTVDILQLGQIKNEAIGVSWDSSSNLVVGALYFSTNSSFGFSPMPTPAYNITGTLGGHSSGQIKYVLTVPNNFCSQTITTNCLDSTVSTFVVPVSITAVLDGKEVRNTIFLKITVLTQQTIATYLIIALATFAILGVLISRIKREKKKPNRVVKNGKTKMDKTKYLKDKKL